MNKIVFVTIKKNEITIRREGTNKFNGKVKTYDSYYPKDWICKAQELVNSDWNNFRPYDADVSDGEIYSLTYERIEQ